LAFEEAQPLDGTALAKPRRFIIMFGKTPDNRVIPIRKDAALMALVGGKQFEIVADQSVGFYLYVFEGDKCTHDYLQDSEELAKKCAADLFQVPTADWKSIVA
jgi:hypothetical protein